MPEQIKPRVPAKYLYIAIPLIVIAIVYMWHQRTISIKRACSVKAENNAHQLYVSQLGESAFTDESELQSARDKGTYLRPVYEFEYEKCLELKGL